jgi:F-type H+-transporting ATPase subunit epsilon
MATFHFELVSPEKLLFSDNVDQVDVPGAEGDFGVFAEHAALVSLLRPGILAVTKGGETRRFIVLGGFAEVSRGRLTVLADVATPVEDVDQARLIAHIKAMEEAVAKMEPGPALDREAAKLNHFRTMQSELGAAATH